MRFYTQQHKHYCGIDLHAKTMYICIIDNTGKKLVHQNTRSNGAYLLKLIEPYKEDIVVGVECMFAWYWLADYCKDNNIP